MLFCMHAMHAIEISYRGTKFLDSTVTDNAKILVAIEQMGTAHS